MPVTTFRPNAAGDLTELLPLSGNWGQVDEDGAGDGDTTKVSNLSGGAYKKDLYHIPNHTSEVGVIDNIKVYFRMKNNVTGGGASDGYGKALIKTGATEYLGGEEINDTGDYVLYTHTWPTNPFTGIAWTWDDIDALQIGVALHAEADSDAYCTQVWVNVYFLAVAVFEDPFTKVLKGLWNLLESSAIVSSLVSVENRIKLWEGSAKPEKTKRSKADLPEIMIEPVGGTINPNASSTGAQVIQTYRIKMIDGDLRVHKTYFPLKWAIFSALVSLDKYLDLEFVRRITIEDGTDDRNDEAHPGWNCGIDIIVEMWFDRKTMFQ